MSHMAATVPIRDTGMVTAGIKVVFNCPKKIAMTTNTIITAMKRVNNTSLRAPWIKTALSEVLELENL